MTKFNLLTIMVLAMALGMPNAVSAQKMLAFPDPDPAATSPRHNFYLDYVGSRLKINSPAAVEGTLFHTISNNGDGGADDWGGDLNSTPINDIEIIKAVPFDACATLTNTTQLAGKIALVMRGDCEFGSKALRAQTAGAIAIIIINNQPGPAVGMAAGADGGSVTIPVLMVSNSDGIALSNAANPKATMRVWSNGFSNDLGIVDGGMSLFHAASIPLNQLKGSSSNILKGFDGAVIGNFGSATANDVKVKVTVNWTPGTPGSITGTPTEVHKDSMVITTAFAPSDSIITPMFNNDYSFNPTTTGRYDVEYEVSTTSFTDDFPSDNKASYSFYVDNRIYSKGTYDFGRNKLRSGPGTTVAGGGEFMPGAMYFVEKGNYAIEKIKFIAYNDDNAQDMSGKGTVSVAIYKWSDANNDDIMVATECDLVGFQTRTFAQGDTSGMEYSVDVTDPADVNKQVATDNNSWYWATISVPGGVRVAFDGELNYFTRSWGRRKSPSTIRELYSPIFIGNYTGWTGNITTAHYPFDINASLTTGGGALEDSVRFSQQRRGMVASIAMQMSLWNVDVEEVKEAKTFDISVYPNPATEDVVNVSLALEKEAQEVQYGVFSVFGSMVQQESHKNVLNDTYTISTKSLAAGSYYVMINVDGTSQVRKFTVVK